MGWSAGGSLSAVKEQLAGCGTATAALSIGGYDEAFAYSDECESYDGAAWAAEADYVTGLREVGACGLLNAALCFGGDALGAVDTTREYDGAAWSAGGVLSGTKSHHGGAGTQTAGLCVGGIHDTNGDSIITEEYDGASWSAGGNLNTGRDMIEACGIQTDALAIGGAPGAVFSNIVEEYDGAAWAAGGSLLQGRRQFGAFSTAAAGMVCGGDKATFTLTDTTEKYNGAAWSAEDAMLTPTKGHGCAGDDSAGLAFAGEDELTWAPVATTMEWGGADPPNLGDLAENLPMLTLVTEGSKYLIETLPALTLLAVLEERSGRVRESLPSLVGLADGQMGAVGRVSAGLPGLLLSASGLSGSVGQVTLAAPMLSISAAGWTVGVGTLRESLPSLLINAFGNSVPVTFRVLALNPKKLSVTEYEGWSFNSFCFFAGRDLAASETGIHVLGGEKDAGNDIAGEMTLGQVSMEGIRARDVWLGGRSDGDMEVVLAADEGTAQEFVAGYLLTTLGQDRAIVPRGLKPVYLQVGVKNVAGSSFDLDAVQVYGEPMKRKKR